MLQDPLFTREDITFLRKRGHIVPDEGYQKQRTFLFDPELPKKVSSSTFCFAAGLTCHATIDLITAAKPSLCLMNHLLKFSASSELVFQLLLLSLPHHVSRKRFLP